MKKPMEERKSFEGPKMSNPWKMRYGKRKLQANTNCGENGRTTHCVYPEENDVYSLPVPTHAPTISVSPTAPPTLRPTEEIITVSPTVPPTLKPTAPPSIKPTKETITAEAATKPPTVRPTKQPIAGESITPPPIPPTTRSPTTNEAYYEYTITTKNPTFAPSKLETISPTLHPTETNTNTPTIPPTDGPTDILTDAPTVAPISTPPPTYNYSPTYTPTTTPTEDDPNSESQLPPTEAPTLSKIEQATPEPTNVSEEGLVTGPRTTPTFTPTESATAEATSEAPTAAPTAKPTHSVTTVSPTISPSQSSTGASSTEAPTSEATESSNSESISFTPAPTASPSQEATEASSTAAPTVESTSLSSAPTASPNQEATEASSTDAPTMAQSTSLTPAPTASPSQDATEASSTAAPTMDQSTSLTPAPTASPSQEAAEASSTAAPTSDQFTSLSPAPTASPSQEATEASNIEAPRTDAPTIAPSQAAPGNANQGPDASVPTSSPYFTFGPQSPATEPTTSESTIPNSCESDSEGNFGLVAPLDTQPENVFMVSYRYQLETVPKFEITEADLNQSILRSVEKAISDLMVDSFFPDAMCNENVAKRRLQVAHRLQATNETNEVVGLAADPPDYVLDGDLGQACPYPLIDADTDDMGVPPCYVVGGAMSFFMDSQDLGDLSWVDEKAQADLKEAMTIGALDNVDPAIAYIRYIPPDADLSAVADEGSKSTNAASGSDTQDNTPLSSAPAWPWILAGAGFILLAIALLLVTVYRKRKGLNESTDFGSVAKSPKGAFPVPIEIVDDNSEFDHDEIYKDDDEEEKMNEEDAILARTKPPSWRQVPEPPQGRDDEYSLLQINATDPNQPVVKPVLDEEAETYISNV